jgi:uroporphyrinogen decarboxylase
MSAPSEQFFPDINKDWHSHATKRFAGPFVGVNYDRVDVDPIVLPLAAIQSGYTLKEFYMKPRLGLTSVLWTNEMYDLLPVTHWFYSNVWLRELGCKLEYKETLPPVVTGERPVKAPEDVDKLRVIDVPEIEKGPTFMEFADGYDYIAKYYGNWLVPIHFGFCPTAMAAEMTGVDKFMLWTIKQPKLCHKIMETIVDTSANGAIAIAKKYGFAMMVIGGVLANSDLLAPAKVKEFGLDYHIRLVKKAFKGGAGPQLWYHLCGNHSKDYMIWKDEVMSPFTVMHIGYMGKESFPVKTAKELYGNRATIMSSVDTKVMYRGTPREIYDISKQMILDGKDSPRGFVHGCACEVPAYAPPANIYAMVKAAREWGKY